jgi:predicted GTPase
VNDTTSTKRPYPLTLISSLGAIIIMGAAGRDFPNFNVYFRRNDVYRVVAFTATQIPGIGEQICDSAV